MDHSVPDFPVGSPVAPFEAFNSLGKSRLIPSLRSNSRIGPVILRRRASVSLAGALPDAGVVMGVHVWPGLRDIGFVIVMTGAGVEVGPLAEMPAAFKTEFALICVAMLVAMEASVSPTTSCVKGTGDEPLI